MEWLESIYIFLHPILRYLLCILPYFLYILPIFCGFSVLFHWLTKIWFINVLLWSLSTILTIPFQTLKTTKVPQSQDSCLGYPMHIRPGPARLQIPVPHSRFIKPFGHWQLTKSLKLSDLISVLICLGAKSIHTPHWTFPIHSALVVLHNSCPKAPRWLTVSPKQLLQPLHAPNLSGHRLSLCIIQHSYSGSLYIPSRRSHGPRRQLIRPPGT